MQPTAGLESRMQTYTLNSASYGTANVSPTVHLTNNPIYPSTTTSQNTTSTLSRQYSSTVVDRPRSFINAHIDPCSGELDYTVIRPRSEVRAPLEWNSLEMDFYQLEQSDLHRLEEVVKGVEVIYNVEQDFRGRGELIKLKNFAQKQGWRAFKEEVAYSSSPWTNGEQLTLAYTNPQLQRYTIIGGGTSIFFAAKEIQDMMSILGLDSSIQKIIDEAIIEEYMHNVQPQEILDIGMKLGMIELTEAHVRSWKALYFFERANQADSEQERTEYDALSKFAFVEYVSLLYAHKELFEVRMGDEEFFHLVETMAPEELVLKLAGMTDENNAPCPCDERRYGSRNSSDSKTQRRKQSTTKLTERASLEDILQSSPSTVKGSKTRAQAYNGTHTSTYKASKGKSYTHTSQGSYQAHSSDESAEDGEGSDSQGASSE